MLIWNKSFELGIPIIDEQHQELITIANKLYRLNSQHNEDDNYDNIMVLIGELQAYTLYHFNTEEALLHAVDYPEFSSHKKEHEAFIAYLKTINYEKIEREQDVFLNELLKQIIHWIFNHIKTVDFLYKPFVTK